MDGLARIFKHKNIIFANINDNIYSLKGDCYNLFAGNTYCNVFINEKELNYVSESYIIESIYNESYQIYAFIKDNEIVASLILFHNTIDNYAQKNKSIYICNFSVLEKNRRQGYGSLLFKEIENLYNGLNIHLKVQPCNLPAYYFYKKHGFKCIKKNMIDVNYNIVFDLLEK